MGEFTTAFTELLACQTETIGALRATIDGTNAAAFVQKLTYDDIVVAGGIAESGGFKLLMRSTDFPTKPRKNSLAVYAGISLYVLSIDDANGTYEITIGNPAAQE